MKVAIDINCSTELTGVVFCIDGSVFNHNYNKPGDEKT